MMQDLNLCTCVVHFLVIHLLKNMKFVDRQAIILPCILAEIGIWLWTQFRRKNQIYARRLVLLSKSSWIIKFQIRSTLIMHAFTTIAPFLNMYVCFRFVFQFSRCTMGKTCQCMNFYCYWLSSENSLSQMWQIIIITKLINDALPSDVHQ